MSLHAVRTTASRYRTPAAVFLSLLLAPCTFGGEIRFAGEQSIDTPGATADIELVDLDGDNDLDIVTLEVSFRFAVGLADGFLTMIENAGDGTIGRVETLSLGSSPALENAFHNLEVGDFNADDQLDLAYIGTTTPLTILFGNGTGFDPPTTTTITAQAGQLVGLLESAELDDTPGTNLALAHPLRVTARDTDRSVGLDEIDVGAPFGGFTLEIADVNNDLRPDLILAGRAYVNNGQLEFTSGPLISTGFIFDMALADFDLDLDLDAAVVRFSQSGELVLSLNNAGTSFTPQPPIALADDPVRIAIDQFDHDPVPDLIITHREVAGSSPFSVLRGRGDGTFDPPLRIDANRAMVVAAGDLNDDGLADLVYGPGSLTGDGPVTIRLNATSLVGDLNCDGVISVGDINPFVLALTDPGAYDKMFPDCDITTGDFNDDGNVTVGDINGFVAAITGG